MLSVILASPGAKEGVNLGVNGDREKRGQKKGTGPFFVRKRIFSTCRQNKRKRGPACPWTWVWLLGRAYLKLDGLELLVVCRSFLAVDFVVLGVIFLFETITSMAREIEKEIYGA